MKVLITGDSHTAALRLGQEALAANAAIGDIDITILPLGSGALMPTPFFRDAGSHAELTAPGYRQHVKRVPPAKASYDWIGISAPLHSTRIWRQDWHAHRPWSLPAGRKPEKGMVSSGLLNQVIDDDVRYASKFVDVVRRNVPVFVIEAPAPFRHHDAVTVNGPELVMHIHRTYRERVLSKLVSQQVPVIDLDPDWTDSDGFMKPRFKRSNPMDQHHGNAEFGGLMYARIVEFLKRQREGLPVK